MVTLAVCQKLRCSAKLPAPHSINKHFLWRQSSIHIILIVFQLSACIVTMDVSELIECKTVSHSFSLFSMHPPLEQESARGSKDKIMILVRDIVLFPVEYRLNILQSYMGSSYVWSWSRSG